MPEHESWRRYAYQISESDKLVRISLVSIAFVLLSVIILALVYLATGTSTAVTATLSFAGGVSNIFLPCTLPLAFIIGAAILPRHQCSDTMARDQKSGSLMLAWGANPHAVLLDRSTYSISNPA